jgi:hypothetical protein
MAYYFFDFTSPQKCTIDGFLRSLTSRISSHPHARVGALLRFYAEHLDGQEQPSQKKLLGTLRETLEGSGEVYLVIDALDECKERERLLQILSTMRGWNLRHLHILFTSRKEVDMEEGLRFYITDRIDIEPSVLEADIRLLTKEAIYGHWRLKQLANETKKKIQQTLVSKAQGM